MKSEDLKGKLISYQLQLDSEVEYHLFGLPPEQRQRRNQPDSLICLHNNRLLRFLSKLKPLPETDRTKFWATTQHTEAKASWRGRTADAGAPGLARPSDVFPTPECRVAEAHVSKKLGCPTAWVVCCSDGPGEQQALALPTCLHLAKTSRSCSLPLQQRSGLSCPSQFILIILPP